MALKLGELVAYLKTDNSGLDRGLADGKAKTRRAGRDMERDAERSGRGIGAAFGRGGRAGGEQFVRDASGRLRDSRGRFVAAGDAVGRAASTAVGGGLAAAGQAVSGFASSIGNVAGNIWTFIPALVGIGAAAAGAAPLVGLLGGALGSLPALLGGLVAVTGVLGLGFMGLGDAFKKTAGGSAGGAVVDRAWQIAQAERRVRDANEEVTASQENLTRARKRAAEATADLAKAEERAKENLQDLNRELAGAKLDQESAALAVAEAEAELADVRKRSNDPLEIQRAELALRQAQQAVEDSTDRVEDLGKEHDEAAKKGIKGSDEVKAAEERQQEAIDAVNEALKRQRNALEGVADAEHALKEARKPPAGGGGGGAGDEITKLAPSAMAAVAAIKSLKPAFDDLRLDVQERLFAGVGGKIKELASAWLPTLHTRLGGLADTLNGLFHNAADTAKDPDFVRRISTGLGSVDRLIKRVGTSITGPFLDAWSRLAEKAEPFIDSLGENIGGLIDDFSAWIKSADESGELENFFERAADFLDQVFAIGKDVGSIIGSIMGAIFGSADKKDPLEGFADTLHKVAEWFQDPANAAKVEEFFGKLIDYGGQVFDFIQSLGPLVGPAFTAISAVVENSTFTIGLLVAAVSGVATAIKWVGKNAPKWWAAVSGAFGKAKDWVVDKANSLINWFGSMPGKIRKKTSGLFDGLKNAFRGAINWIIGKWNGLQFSLPGGSFLGMSWGGTTFGTPDIPYLAKGGIVPATPGGRLAVVGEGREDEAVMPLSKLAALLGNQRSVLELRSGGGRLEDLLIEILRIAIQGRGGNVQVVLGKG
ncbi:hypothetical protein [Actinoplanes sp. NPDC049599]|uniref:hypothetical protein n=1 Tax=Actinoplanes sp. NPDC049599 TaxID=3363903 RepID=UPI0037A55CC6